MQTLGCSLRVWRQLVVKMVVEAATDKDSRSLTFLKPFVIVELLLCNQELVIKILIVSCKL